MVKSFPNTLRWRILMLKADGLTNREVAKTLHVSERFVYKVNQLYAETLDVSDPPRRKSKQRLLTATDLLILRRVIERNPELYLDEIQQWMLFATGELFSLQTISRSLKQMGMSVKKMQIFARERNELQRAAYRRFISQFKAEQLLFLDESARDERTVQRKFARSLGGTRISRRGNFTRGTRYSVLGAVSVSGMKSAHVIVGPYDRLDFETAVEKFIAPLVGSFAKGEPCSVVVLDNCAIHLSPEFLHMIRSKGGIVVFLPPYSPDLNPIEKCFGVAKAWLKRHADVCTRYPKRCFEMALLNISDDGCANIFNDCGYM